MKGMKISNMIGKVFIILSIILIAGTFFQFSDLLNQNDIVYQPVVTLPSGIQYTIKDPFRQKDNLMQIFQLIKGFIGSIVLAISGAVVCISTKKQIKKIKM